MITFNYSFWYSKELQFSLAIFLFLNWGGILVHTTPTVFQPTSILNSMKNLTEWAMKEETIYKLVKIRYRKLKRELKIIEEYIGDFKGTTEKAVISSHKPLKTVEDRAKFVASSGITSYRMIYRYVKSLSELKSVLTEYDHLLEDILLQSTNPEVHLDNNDQNNIDWPSWIDLNDAMQSLLHIHEINDFPLHQLPAILSPETHRPTQLTAFHCVQIGMFALHQELFDLSVEWLYFAAEKVSKGDTSIHSSIVNNYLAMVIQSHNAALAYLPDYEPSVFVHNVTLGDAKRIKRRSLQSEHFAGRKQNNFVTINFWSLCSGKNLQTQEELSRLYCYYDHKVHPVWFIGPLKVELLSQVPLVLQIYDVLSNKLIQDIMTRSQVDLTRSFVIVEENSPIMARSRTSVNSWMDDEEVPLLTKKVEMITGLNAYGETAAEKLQVVEYVFGRYYSVHTDPLSTRIEQIPVEQLESGDRLATVLFYLNDVPAGGYTPFANAGAYAPPIKGSAIFWYNLYRNGTVREDTWHGACPVIYGHKIVANKWIRYNAQFNTYQCSLDSNE